LHLFSLTHDELHDALTNDEFGLWVRKDAQSWLKRPEKAKRSKRKVRLQLPRRKPLKKSRLKKNESARQRYANRMAQGVQIEESEQSRLNKNEESE
jgi:hypothetical protein